MCVVTVQLLDSLMISHDIFVCHFVTTQGGAFYLSTPSQERANHKTACDHNPPTIMGMLQEISNKVRCLSLSTWNVVYGVCVCAL